jgi:hypothetical protein
MATRMAMENDVTCGLEGVSIAFVTGTSQEERDTKFEQIKFWQRI